MVDVLWGHTSDNVVELRPRQSRMPDRTSKTFVAGTAEDPGLAAAADHFNFSNIKDTLPPQPFQGPMLIELLHQLQEAVRRGCREQRVRPSPAAMVSQRKLLHHLREAEIQAMILRDEGAP